MADFNGESVLGFYVFSFDGYWLVQDGDPEKDGEECWLRNFRDAMEFTSEEAAQAALERHDSPDVTLVVFAALH